MAVYRILEYTDGTFSIQKRRYLRYKNVLDKRASKFVKFDTLEEAEEIVERLIKSDPRKVKQIHGPYNSFCGCGCGPM